MTERCGTMETTIIAVIESLDSKPKEFRDQVNAFRDFKNKMRDAGVVPEEEQFALPSLRRLETLPAPQCTNHHSPPTSEQTCQNPICPRGPSAHD